MQEFRCCNCAKLLGRFRRCKELEIKCPRCGRLNLKKFEAYTKGKAAVS